MKAPSAASTFSFQSYIIGFLLLFLMSTGASAQVTHWKVGDKVEAGPNGYHPATILEVSKAGVSYRLHYDDNAHGDNEWVETYWIRAHNTKAKADGQAAKGPRAGKYMIYVYLNGSGSYDGFFSLDGRGNYEVFLPGGKDAGKGTYSFNSATRRLIWNSGPFTNKDWDGTQQLEVSREGKTHIIRLRKNTIGTNSSDSNVKL